MAPVEDKTISMEKTTFAPGEEIKINFNNADRSNSDWLCIYAGAESEYGVSGGPVSLQYAYIGGNGTVIFNDLDGRTEPLHRQQQKIRLMMTLQKFSISRI